MNVAYSASDLYSELAATSIASLLENNKDVDEINIFIIDIEISEKHKQDLLDLAASYGRYLKFLEDLKVEDIVHTKINVGCWHISTFSRLFLLHVLPETIDKVIYIDCDMIIRHSLKTLWETEMEGAWCMSADDCRGRMYRKDIGIPDESIYTNNGLMVIDLAAWRDNDVESNFVDFINSLRVEHACTLLEQGCNITEIAFSSGFSSIRTFNRVFAQNMNMAPRDYIRYKENGAAVPVSYPFLTSAIPAAQS